jgi:peptidoglycan/LPS O-acetylase OafA/YrhL
MRRVPQCAKSGASTADPCVSKLLHVQLLRAFAASSVAMLHAQNDAASLAVRFGQAFEPPDRFPWAAGVDVFFVISGFIMVHASRDLFCNRDARAIFLSRRIARIVPLYWAVTTLYLITAIAAPSLLNSAILEPWPVIASYLFIPFARPDGLAQPLYSLGWTLNYEMAFYAVFALAIVFARRRAVLGLTGLMATLVAVGAAVPLPQPFAFWTDPIILEFAFGLLLGLFEAEGMRLGRAARAGLVLAGVVILSVDFARPEGLIVLPRVLAWGLPAMLLVAAAALGFERTAPPGPVARFGVAVGDASYALYLLHPFSIRAGREFATRTGLAALLGPWGYIAFALAGAIAVSLAVHRWFERPTTIQMRRWLEPVRSPQWSSP